MTTANYFKQQVSKHVNVLRTLQLTKTNKSSNETTRRNRNIVSKRSKTAQVCIFYRATQLC